MPPQTQQLTDAHCDKEMDWSVQIEGPSEVQVCSETEFKAALSGRSRDGAVVIKPAQVNARRRVDPPDPNVVIDPFGRLRATSQGTATIVAEVSITGTEVAAARKPVSLERLAFLVNAGFETGDFTAWTLETYVENGDPNFDDPNSSVVDASTTSGRATKHSPTGFISTPVGRRSIGNRSS